VHSSGQLALVETIEAQTVGRPQPELLGAYIERPETGAQADVYMLHVSGWVLGKRSSAVAVEVLHDGELLRSAPVRGARADIESEFGIGPGIDAEYHALVGVLGLPPVFELELVAVLEDETRTAIGSVRARREPVRVSREPAMRPVLLTTLPGTGSTSLMDALAAHPSVVVQDPDRGTSAGRYWVHMLKVLAEPANLVESSDPVSFPSDPALGHNPFYDDGVAREKDLGEWLGRTHVEQLADLSRSFVEQWYSIARQEQDKPSSSCFAEKHLPDHVPWLMRELYPNAREIFFVRDSTAAPAGETARLWSAWDARAAGSLLVGHDELVADPTSVIARVLAYLEIESTPARVHSLVESADMRQPAR
jgi:hypothetical protein